MYVCGHLGIARLPQITTSVPANDADLLCIHSAVFHSASGPRRALPSRIPAWKDTAGGTMVRRQAKQDDSESRTNISAKPFPSNYIHMDNATHK